MTLSRAKGWGASSVRDTEEGGVTALLSLRRMEMDRRRTRKVRTRKVRRTVRAKLDDSSGVVVFSLAEGARQVRTFAYGRKHRLWFSMEREPGGVVIVSHASEASVKEEIAGWVAGESVRE
jgi:hypothetical protein